MGRVTVFRCIALVWFFAGLTAGPAAIAADNSSSTFFGPHPSLTAGVQALHFKDYESGVRLTLDGIEHTTSRRQKAAALS
ncbi:MAG: hypothetical protein QNJ73_05480, partial [Gammaproteobacteria bacterium]|nr:hypothetical protein [Gammaproteobacteria bacterium]